MAWCLIVVCSTAIYSQKAKRYALKSGYVKLELTGSTVGTKELWWDDFGEKTCEIEKSVTTTKLFGMKTTEEKHAKTIVVKDNYWTVNYIENTGCKGTVPGYNIGQEMSESMTEEEREAFANGVLESMGGQKLGSESLNGYSCDVFTIMGCKSWLYKGVAIKSEVKVMGIVNNEMFTDLKPGISVPASTFTAPTDVNYQDLSAAQNNFFAQMGNMPAMEDMDDDDDDLQIPVEYPFDKFKSVVNGFSYGGYKSRGVNSVFGVHASTLTKGFSSLTIVAESRKNAEEGEYSGMEKFTHNGHNCYYGEMEEEEGTALIIDYPAYDMYIIIAALPTMDKSTLVSISDKLQF